MSMANLFVQGGCAYLMTDSGYFGRDGKIRLLHPKTMVLPAISLAFTVTGAHLHCGLIAQQIGDEQFTSVHQFLRRLPSLVREAYTSSAVDPEDFWSRVIVAFYSHEFGRAFGCTLFTSTTAGPAELAPWRVHPAKKVIGPSVDERSVYPSVLDLTDPQAFDPACDSVPLIMAQRRATGNWACVSDGCFVAGDIDLTVVSAGGVEVKTLHSFPDVIGEKAGRGANRPGGYR